MAANAKEYNDLTQTTEISNDALVAVATPGASQLQTSTVTTLAAKVGELNTAGALAELELATSIGKQQLAEVLTEKGVSTTASETLVQMADKVQSLQVSEGVDNIKGYYVDTSGVPSNLPTGASSMRAFRNPKTGDSIVLLGTTIYCIPNGEYDSLSAFLAAATKTLDVSQEDSAYDVNSSNYAAVSEDFTKLLVRVNSSTYVNNVYNLSGETITKIGSVTKDFTSYRPATAVGLAIHDNGDLILYQTDSLVLKLYRISTGEEYTINLPNVSNADNYMLTSIIKPGKIYVAKGGTGNSYTRIFIISYSIDEATKIVNIGDIVYTDYTYGSGPFNSKNSRSWIHIPGEDDVPVLYASGDSYQASPDSRIVGSAHNIIYETAYVWVPAAGSSYTIIRGQLLPHGTNARFLSISLVCDSYTVTAENYNLVLSFPYRVGTITVNRNSGEVSYSSDWNNYVVLVPTIESAYSRFLFKSAVSVSIGTGGYDNGNVGSQYRTYPMSKEYDKIIFAKRLTRNGKVAYYDPRISLTDIESGAYDLETSVVPLPEEPGTGVGVISWTKGTYPSGLPNTLYTAAIPTSATPQAVYTDAALTTLAKTGGVSYRIYTSDTGYTIGNASGLGERYIITIQG